MVISKYVIKKQGVRAWNGFIWLKTETCSPAAVYSLIYRQVP